MFSRPPLHHRGLCRDALLPMTIHGIDGTSSLNKVYGYGLEEAKTRKVPQDYYLHDFVATLLHLVADTDETAQKLFLPLPLPRSQRLFAGMPWVFSARNSPAKRNLTQNHTSARSHDRKLPIWCTLMLWVSISTVTFFRR